MASENTSGVIHSRKDFAKTPSGQYKYWLIELQASFKRLRQWHQQADSIQRRFLDDRTGFALGSLPDSRSPNRAGTKFALNLFHSNTKTICNLLYGKLPRIDVSRTDKTGNDDVARVAAETLERLMRQDLADHGEENEALLKAVLTDRMLPGLGCARVRYEMEEQDGQMVSESAPCDYYYWADVTWGWSRSFTKLPWLAYRSFLSKDRVAQRFGEKVAEKLKYEARDVGADKDSVQNRDLSSAWQEAEIWEIWDKKQKKVVWVSIGYDKVLETRDDPLQLRNFFPSPPFFIANATNALYIPTPDYHLSQDLYNEIDVLQTRISILTEAVKVIGVYDASADGIQRMFKEGVENDLIPVDNWAMFAEKGGIQGQIDWVPIQEIVAALNKLIEVRDQTIGLLQQITGMADVMRGELASPYEGVGQTQIKSKFASARVQAISEDFAKFATDLHQIKAEIVCKHFSPETIAKMSNMQFSNDVQLLPDAIQLLKTMPDNYLRVEIKSETMAQEDYLQLQAQRQQYLAGLSEFLSAASPLIQQDPRSTPFLLQMLKWAMAGYKGASEIEGVLDQAIEVMQQPEQQQQPPSDTEIQGQQQIQLEQLRQQGKMQVEQMKLQAEQQTREHDMRMDIATRQAEQQMEMEKAAMDAFNEREVIAAKMEADIMTELYTSQINADQKQAEAESEIYKEIEKAKIKVVGDVAVKREERATKAMELEAASFEHDKDIAASMVKPNGGDTVQ